MALIPGQTLADSENDKKTARRTLSYDPFQQRALSNTNNSFFSGARDLVSNAVFNFVDSVLFGVPSGLMEANVETVQGRGFYDEAYRTYGEGFESFGIKPYERLSGAGKFGLGFGQAAGFFVPYSGLSKATSLVQRAALSNISKLAGEAVETGIKGISTGNPIKSVIKNTVLKNKDTIPFIYRSTPDDYSRFSKTLTDNIRKEASEFAVSNNLQLTAANIDDIASRTVRALEDYGKSGRYVDNFEDLVSGLGRAYGDTKFSRSIAGYMGRAIDQSVNMALYEGLGHLTRASFDANNPDIDYNAFESMKHSAGFAAVITAADFIPGGRRAGMFKDFYKVARTSLARGRNFKQMYADGKINDNQVKTLAAWFGKQAKSTPKGMTANQLEIGKAPTSEILSWLDDIYSANRKDLLKAIISDGGRSLVGSLPRMAIDGAATAFYMNGREGFLHTLDDESMLADYLVGAFMAMRAYRPLDSKARQRYRYDNTIDSRMSFMEQMGIDTSHINNTVKGLNTIMRDVDFFARNVETVKGGEEIYNALFKKNIINNSPDRTKDTSGHQAKREFIDTIVKHFTPKYMREGKYLVDDIQIGYENGDIVDARTLTDSQLIEVWNSIKDIETSTGRKIEEYEKLGYERFREDFEKNIVKNHADILSSSVRDFAKEVGILISADNTRDGKIIVNGFEANTGNDKVDFFLQRIYELENLGYVEIRKDNPKVLTSVLNDAEKIDRINNIADNYSKNSAEYFDSQFNFDPMDNPALDYISEYSALVARNKMEDAMYSRAREGDDDYNAVVSRINEVVGVNVPTRGITIDTDNLTENQKKQLPELQTMLEEIKLTKQSAGMGSATAPERVVSFEDAKGLHDTLTGKGYYYVNNDVAYISGRRSTKFRQDMVDRALIAHDIDRSDYFAVSVLRERFGTPDGRISLPTVEVVKNVIHAELTDRGVDERVGDMELLPEGTPMRAEFDELIKNYTEFVRRVSKTNLVSVDRTEYRKDEFEDTDLRDVVNTIKDIYAYHAKGELDDLSKIHREKSATLRDLHDKLEILNREYSDLLSEGSSDKDRQQKANEVFQLIRQNLSQIQDATDYFGMKGVYDIMERALNKFEDVQSVISNDSLLKQLFSTDTMKQISDASDFSFEVMKLANITKSSIANTAAYANIRARLIGMIKNDENRQKVNSDTIDTLISKVFNESDNKGLTVENVKNIISDLNKQINTMTKQSDVEFASQISTREIQDILRQSTSENHRANAQSFLTRIKNLGLSELLDKDKKKLNSEIQSGLQVADKVESTVNKIINSIKSKDPDKYSSNEYRILQEVVSTIETLNSRNEKYENLKIQSGSIVYDNTEVSTKTPIGDFAARMREKGIASFIIKDSYIDDNGNAKKLTDLTIYEANSVLTKALDKVVQSSAVSRKIVRDEAALITASLNNSGIARGDIRNSLFIPLQANEDVGILVSRNKEDIQALRESFRDFTKRVLVPDDRKEAFQETVKIITDGLSDTPTNSAIAGAVRAMYYHDNITKDVFFQMIGKDNDIYNTARDGQNKVFKYVSHVNSKNAVSYSANTLKMIGTAINQFSVKPSNSVIRELNRRAKEGVRVFVYDDESLDSNGNPIKGTTARDIIENTILENMKRNGIVPNPERINQLVEQTAKDYGIDVSSLDNRISDGVTYASRDAMALDAFLMGGDINSGVTAAKMQFHSNKDASLIGKTAVRYDESLNKFMRDNNIDYIIPKTSAKSWDNKDDIAKLNQYDNTKSVGENLSQQFTGKIKGNSYKTFEPESVKYLYPAHSFGSQGNTNSSVFHFISSDGVSDYNKQLAIKQMIDKVSMYAKAVDSSIGTSGLEAMFKSKYDDSIGTFSRMSAIEQMMSWGLSAENTLVRDSVMRAVKDVVYGSLLSQRRSDVVNTFLFSDSRLRSPLYNGTTVKSFGEIRLPDSSRNEEFDNDTSLVFSHKVDDDFQDYLLNNADNKLKVQSPNGANFYSADIAVKTAMQTVWNHLRSKGTYGSANETIRSINNFLSSNSNDYAEITFLNGRARAVFIKEFGNQLKILRDNGVRDLSIAVNSHKIPKKFAADSIVNRLEGFADRNKGNVVEANNYEIAAQHQADQDGDKITVYMKMPFSFLLSSSRNMSLAKEAKVIKPDESSMPNVFEVFNQAGNFSTSLNDANNVSKYMGNERKSKYLVGSTVKLQGIATLLNMSNVSFEGKPLMKFGHESNADYQDAASFARSIGSVTQSILDAWKGVHSSLLDLRKVKDFILFGEPTGIKELDDNWKGMFKIPNDIVEAGGIRKDVYKDFVRETVKVFEDVYGALGDAYEGGVANKPEYSQLVATHTKIKNLFSGDNYYIFNSLMGKYKRIYNKTESNAKISELKSLFAITNSNGVVDRVRTVFSFGRSFEDMVENHPHMAAINGIVTKFGDVLRNDDLNLVESDFVKRMFMYGEDGAFARQISTNEEIIYSSFDINQKELNSMYNDIRGHFENPSNNPFAPKNLGLFNRALEIKIRQLEQSKYFYRKIGDDIELANINEHINYLTNKKEEVNAEVFKLYKENVGTGKIITKNLTESPFKNNNKKAVHLYKVNKKGDKELYEFARTIQPGDYAPRYMKGEYMILLNPIESRPFEERSQMEGFAMEKATANFYNEIRSATGSKSRTDDIVNIVRGKIEQAKYRLRELNSETIGLSKDFPSVRSDVYDNESFFADIELDGMFKSIDFFLEKNGLDKPEIIQAIGKMLLTPRVEPSQIIKTGTDQYLPSYKIDKKFTQSVMKFFVDNSDTYSDYMIGFENGIRSFSAELSMANGILPKQMHGGDDVDLASRYEYYNDRSDDQGANLLRSLTDLAQNNVFLRNALGTSFRDNDVRVDYDGVRTYNEVFKTKESYKKDDLIKTCGVF